MSNSELFSTATQNALEFPSLKALLGQLAACDLGRERISGLAPFPHEETLRLHRRRYDEARRLVAERPLVQHRDQPFLPRLAALESGGLGLDGKDLVELAALLEITADAMHRIRGVDPPCPHLLEVVEVLPDFSELRRRLKKTFDARGQIREDASPKLAELRSNSRRVRSRLYEQLRSSVEELKDNLSEDTIPMRGGRLVLMLQAGSKGRSPGLIHGRSSSGRSFYFEPLGVVDDNNQLQQLSEEEDAERRRILREIIDIFRNRLDELVQLVDWVALLDLLQASVRFAEKAGGCMADLAVRHELVVKAGRHPLLDPRLAPLREEALGAPGHRDPIIPLDITLSKTQRALVITGPNAGGKTVALKTLGLLALANQCGLPIPAAAGSRLPFLQAIVATVGDDQDLLADRSTFSGRLIRLAEAWEAAGPDSLVLLDELGSGTDPEEGAALSTAILEGFLERQSLLLITTHLGQVAAAALESEGAFCGAMLFDSESGSPTYRLLPGPPGGSEALALARRLGLPTGWIERAEELLGSEHRDLRRLLAELEANRNELARTQTQLDQELADAELLRERMAKQEAAMVEERKTLGRTLETRLQEFRDETQRKLRDEIERLRSEVKKGRRKGLAHAATERLFEEAPVFVPEEESTEGPIEVGGAVKHRVLGWEGTLDKLDRGRAQVTVHGKMLSCREEDLRPAKKGSTASKPKPKPRRLTTSDSDLESSVRELMLVGRRVEPALEELDRFLDQALLGSFDEVRIVHGFGTGRLRSAVREWLRGHPAVRSQRPGKKNEGGDGATVVALRGS